METRVSSVGFPSVMTKLAFPAANSGIAGAANWRANFRCVAFALSRFVTLHAIINMAVSPDETVKVGIPESREKSAEDQTVMGSPWAWGQIRTSVRAGPSLE